MQVSCDNNRKAPPQTLAVLPVVAWCQASRVEVMTAALPEDRFEPFEKNGFVVGGRIRIKFDDRGRVVEVVSAWNPP